MGLFDSVVDSGLFGGLAGSLVGGGLSFLGQSSANKSNRQITADQMNFQREMANTAYQRAMADMRKAGLNPILAYKMGGAAVPSGAAIQMQNPWAGAQQSLSSIGSNMASAAQAYRTDKLVEAELSKIESETWRNEISSLLADAQESKTSQETQNVITQGKILKEQLKREENFGKIENTQAGEIMRWINRIMETVSPFR